MTPDIQKSILRACARFLAKRIDPIQKKLDAIEQKTLTIENTFNLESPAGMRTQEQIAQAVARSMDMAALRGKDGQDGKDADPISVAEVAAELLATDGLKALVDLHVAEAVAALPKPQDGKDGAQGPRGEPGEPGTKGDPGADGVGLAGAVIDREGALTLTLTNGETKSLGVIVGRDGENGKNGADFTEVEFDYDGERGLIIRGKGGEIVKRLPIPIDRGYWSEGKSFEHGDVTTHDGTVFIALRDTKAKPCKENAEDWRIMCRKGRDGKDGRNGIDLTKPVKLDGGNG